MAATCRVASPLMQTLNQPRWTSLSPTPPAATGPRRLSPSTPSVTGNCRPVIGCLGTRHFVSGRAWAMDAARWSGAEDIMPIFRPPEVPQTPPRSQSGSRPMSPCIARYSGPPSRNSSTGPEPLNTKPAWRQRAEIVSAAPSVVAPGGFLAGPRAPRVSLAKSPSKQRRTSSTERRGSSYSTSSRTSSKFTDLHGGARSSSPAASSHPVAKAVENASVPRSGKGNHARPTPVPVAPTSVTWQQRDCSADRASKTSTVSKVVASTPPPWRRDDLLDAAAWVAREMPCAVPASSSTGHPREPSAQSRVGSGKAVPVDSEAVPPQKPDTFGTLLQSLSAARSSDVLLGGPTAVSHRSPSPQRLVKDWIDDGGDAGGKPVMQPIHILSPRGSTTLDSNSASARSEISCERHTSASASASANASASASASAIASASVGATSHGRTSSAESRFRQSTCSLSTAATSRAPIVPPLQCMPGTSPNAASFQKQSNQTKSVASRHQDLDTRILQAKVANVNIRGLLVRDPSPNAVLGGGVGLEDLSAGLRDAIMDRGPKWSWGIRPDAFTRECNRDPFTGTISR